MPEPVTAGVLVGSALSAGATTLANGALGEAAKDAYSAVKNAVLCWAGHEVEALEAKSGSPARKAVIAEFIDEPGSHGGAPGRDRRPRRHRL